LGTGLETINPNAGAIDELAGSVRGEEFE